MIKANKEKECCGCRACENICPRKSISMQEGTLGHLFPLVDSTTCVNCGLCLKVCPMKNDILYSQYEKKAFISYNLSKKIRFLSSSGGMFYSLASYFVDNDYFVFGAYFNEELKLTTGYVTSKEALIKMCKSKYLQSNMNGVYIQIKELLEHNEKVAFFGTPCQNHAIRLFLNKEYDNLFLTDFFCHGVPSQTYFDKCKELVEKQKKIKILKYQFREKVTNGSTPHYYSFVYDKKGYIRQKTDFYFKSPNYAAFQTYINLRESCYDCRFARSNRCSDLTLGDFHNVEQYNSKINRFDGVSTLIINSSRGENIINSIADSLYLESIDINLLINNEDIFAGGTKRPNKRDIFVSDYESLSFEELNQKWFCKHKYVKQSIYYRLPAFVRKFLKKF